MAIDFEKLKAELRSSVAQSVVRTITAPVLYNKLLDSHEDAELVVVDVRDGKAFAQSHVRGAVSFAPPVSSVGSSGSGDAKGGGESKLRSQSAGRGGVVSFPAQRADPLDGKAVAVMDARSADRFALRPSPSPPVLRCHPALDRCFQCCFRCSDADAYTAGVINWLQDNVTNCSALYFVKASLSATFPSALPHTASQAFRAYERCGVIAGRI